MSAGHHRKSECELRQRLKSDGMGANANSVLFLVGLNSTGFVRGRAFGDICNDRGESGRQENGRPQGCARPRSDPCVCVPSPIQLFCLTRVAAQMNRDSRVCRTTGIGHGNVVTTNPGF